MDLRPIVARFAQRFDEVEQMLSDPRLFENKQRFQELSREYARLKDLAATGGAYLKTLADLEENRQLLATEPAESELAQLAREEMLRLEAGETRLAREVQRGLLPPDPTDYSGHCRSGRASARASEAMASLRKSIEGRINPCLSRCHCHAGCYNLPAI